MEQWVDVKFCPRPGGNNVKDLQIAYPSGNLCGIQRATTRTGIAAPMSFRIACKTFAFTNGAISVTSRCAFR